MLLYLELFERLPESVSKTKNKSCNRSIDRAVGRNLTAVKGLGTNSSISIVGEVLMGEGGGKVGEPETSCLGTVLRG